LLFTRRDMAVLIALPMLYHFKKNRWPLSALLQFWPLALWFAFSLFYYGFLFPNTKYAKLNTGIPLHNYIAQGLYYFWDFASYDLFSFLFIPAVLGYACLRLKRKKPMPEFATLNLCATLLYLGYVLAVGGDFMAGRFLALPFFACLLLLAQMGSHWAPERLRQLEALMLAGFVMHEAYYLPRGIDSIDPHHGIADERNYYLESATLFPYWGGMRFASDGVRADGGAIAIDYAEDGVVQHNFIGLYGYTAGPELTVIDGNALADPLLARLPVPDKSEWRIGHFTRTIPAGYLYARRTGDTSEMAPTLAMYYTRLRSVTSDDLFSEKRLRHILNFQLGHYDKLRELYLNGK
ncbi:MAG: hypothetical protein K2Q01_07625, partial [Rickettsiales bacterium]|nr:hypothetical protein [Rickettsiales bacterium]